MQARGRSVRVPLYCLPDRLPTVRRGRTVSVILSLESRTCALRGGKTGQPTLQAIACGSFCVVHPLLVSSGLSMQLGSTAGRRPDKGKQRRHVLIEGVDSLTFPSFSRPFLHVHQHCPGHDSRVANSPSGGKAKPRVSAAARGSDW